MSSVLVVHATKYGSTRQVAQAIAKRLSSAGFDVDVRAAADSGDVSKYSAVVLGTALYFFMWRGDAHRFVRRNRAALTSVPLALFGLGPIEDKAEQWAGARANLEKGLAKHPWLKPSAITVFGGRVEPSALRFPDNNPAFRGMTPTDLRDFQAIDAWADTLPEALGIG